MKFVPQLTTGSSLPKLIELLKFYNITIGNIGNCAPGRNVSKNLSYRTPFYKREIWKGPE